MDETKKGLLSEELRVYETEIHDKRSELKTIKYKLETAYKYEEELNNRIVAAKKKTEELRLEFFQKSSEISKVFDKMKGIMDVFTGNFYKHD